MSLHPNTINHAVTGLDVYMLMMRHSLSMEELSELLYVPKNKLNALISSQEPVKDVAVALLVRVYTEYPELIPKFEILEFFAELQGSEEQKLRHLAVCFGRDSSAGYRWIHKGRPMSDQPLALGRLIKRLPNGIEDLRRLSVREATYRGVNPYKTGSWTKPADFDPREIAGRTYKRRTTERLTKAKESGKE